MQQNLAPAPAGAGFAFTDWLVRAAQLKASDVHLHSGYPPLFRMNGNMTPMEQNVLTDAMLRPELLKLLNEDEKETFEQRKDVDFSYEIKGVGRFRCSLFIGYAGINGAFRVLPPTSMSLAELGLPSELERFSDFHHGLLLLTGPAGCGKSTTLASMINLFNEHHQGDHILTLEDPIEIVHPNKGCVVNQRQVPLHTESYARAMRAALREDPDVIVIGEMRDSETISLALTAAETGHLVLASMHTTDAVKSITRIIDAFPPDRQSQIRTMLAESLMGVFSQLLLPGMDGKTRHMAYELLFVNAAISNMIKDKKTFQIPQQMQMGKAQGMCTLGMTISELCRTGKVSREVARRFVDESYLQ
ncbi:MAG TPA: PilT/PilU family type 4a pilus ATPase [Candidatus Obscuribacterales bacterium]